MKCHTTFVTEAESQCYLCSTLEEHQKHAAKVSESYKVIIHVICFMQTSHLSGIFSS